MPPRAAIGAVIDALVESDLQAAGARAHCRPASCASSWLARDGVALGQEVCDRASVGGRRRSARPWLYRGVLLGIGVERWKPRPQRPSRPDLTTIATGVPLACEIDRDRLHRSTVANRRELIVCSVPDVAGTATTTADRLALPPPPWPAGHRAPPATPPSLAWRAAPGAGAALVSANPVSSGGNADARVYDQVVGGGQKQAGDGAVPTTISEKASAAKAAHLTGRRCSHHRAIRHGRRPCHVDPISCSLFICSSQREPVGHQTNEQMKEA